MATDSSFYLSEVAGSDSSASGSGEDLFEATDVLDTSTLSASVRATPQRSSFALRTPPMQTQGTTPSSTQRWDRGPMSPFSPLAKSDRRRTETSLSFVSNTDADLSLISCRKVSVAVSVHVPENNENSQKPTQLCLFPLNMETPSNPGDLVSPISATIRQAVHESTRDLVVVNPSAFGTHIPGQVTMETARLVAQVAHIESEDWARKYRFDDVSWCCRGEDTGSMARLAESLSNDAILRQRSAVCFAIGNLKSTTLFGTRGKPKSGDLPSPRRSPETLGLLGGVYNNLLKELPENSFCTLSLLEILDDDTLRDMLSPDQKDSTSKVKIRHIDHRGAMIQNQTDAPLDSLTGLELLLRNAFYSQPALRLRKQEGPRGHVVCTLKVWENAVQRDLNNINKCVTLQLVDLSGGHDEVWMDAKVLTKMASARKSLSVLRGVLRGLVLQEITGETNTVSYRECTLTKVLQRTLMEEGAHAVILASVSAQSAAYERTLHTLDYVNRLLIRPGKTAQSPFDGRTPASKQSTPVEQVSIEHFGSEETLLKSVTSDPRQRLAKLMGKTSARQRVTPKKLQLEEGYKPTEYMAIDPGDVSYIPVEPQAKVQISANTNLVVGSEVANVSFEPCHHGKGDSAYLDSDLQGWNEGDELGGDLQNFKHEVKSSVEVEESHESMDYSRHSDPTMVKFHNGCDYDLPEMPSILIGMRSLSTHEQQFQDEVDMIKGADLEQYIDFDETLRRVTPADTNCESDDEDDMIDEDDLKTQTDDGVRRLKPSDTDCDPVQVFYATVVKNDEDVEDNALVEQWMANNYAEGGINTRYDKLIHRLQLVSEESSGQKDGLSTMSIVQRTKGTDDNNEAGASNMEHYVPSQFFKVTKTTDHEAASPESDVLRGKLAKLWDDPSPCLSPVIADKKSTSQTNTAIAQELNIFDTREEGKLCRSSETGLDTSYVIEIQNLQGAVDEVKRMHNGLWESSATSLQRLKNFQEAQQRQLDEAVAARLLAEQYAEAADKELMRQADNHRIVSQDYKEQIEELKRNLSNALVDRSSIEKIAEEAIVSQTRTEEELCMYKGELSLAKRQLEVKEGEVEKLLESQNLLVTEVDASKKKTAALTLDHSECGITIEHLEAKVKKLNSIRCELIESINADRGKMAELTSENTQIGELKMKLDLAVQEVQRWKNACGEMQIIMSKQQSSALESVGVKDAELHQLNCELSMLTQELSSSKQQLDDMKGELLRGDEEHKKGVLSLSNDLSLQREHVRRLKEELELSNKAKEAITMHADRANDLLVSRNEDLTQLQIALRDMKEERDQAAKHMERMKEAVDTFQTDAKERVARIVKEKKAIDASLDRALTDMKIIEDSNRSLIDDGERYRRESAIADQTIASLREQAEQLEKQKVQLEREKSELSDKFGQLELTTERLKCQLDAGNHSGAKMQSRSYHETESHLREEIEEQRTRRGTARRFHVNDEQYLSERTIENGQIRLLEKENDQLRLKVGTSSSRHNAVSMEVFRAEQSRRIQAEELTAVISAKAKNGFEDRNDEIVRLKVRLSSIIDEKESEIRMLRLRLLEMEKQQIGTTPEQPRRYHSGDAAFSGYSGSGNDRGFWGM